MDCGQLSSQKGKSLDELLEDTSTGCDLVSKFVLTTFKSFAISVILLYFKCSLHI